MKALTLHQPHAYLVGLGAKIFETRSWGTKFRGLLAIHASRDCKRNGEGIIVGDENPPSIIAPFNRYIKADYHFIYGDLNNGGIEALVVVEDCQPADKVERDLLLAHSRCLPGSKERKRIEEILSFGDYNAGRWVWQLRLELTVQGKRCGVVRGYQGLWNLPLQVEDELLAAYNESTGEQICRFCGCTTRDVKAGRRAWAKPFLCTACAIGHNPAPNASPTFAAAKHE